MQALVVREVDGGRSSNWEQVADPVPANGEAVVAVIAAPLAWSDALQMEGTYAGPGPLPPFTPGYEFAGTVAEPGVSGRYRRGDRVFGFLSRPAAFAEYLIAPEHLLHPTPDAWTDIAICGISTPFLTADAALVTIGGLRPGSSALIHAAAGGVGRSAVQLCREYGAAPIVITAGSAERRAAIARLADVVPASYEDFPEAVAAATGGRGMDVVLESVGGAVFDASVNATAAFGRIVTIGASSGDAPRRLKLPNLWHRTISVAGLHIAHWQDAHAEVLDRSWDRITPLIEEHRIDAGVGLVVPRAEITAGIGALRRREVLGRTIILINGERPQTDRLLMKDVPG